MPTPEQIMNGLHQIANQWQFLAVLWHLYFGVLALGLAWGQRPSKRIGGILLAIPLLSVSVLAWMSANPFNGTVFAVVGLALGIMAMRLPNEPINLAPTWAVGAGTLMLVFGWIYPHFLDTTLFITYLYAAPAGLIPCPTLSIVIGLCLIVSGLDSRAWSIVLGATGIFYSLFGAFRLGVTIDLVLLIGALLVISITYIGRIETPRRSLAH